MKIRKKPIIVDAWIIDTSELVYSGNMPMWVWDAHYRDKRIAPFSDGHDLILRIKTEEGIMSAKDGDVLVKGVKGEFYSIKRSIFDETYDVIDAENLTQSAQGPLKEANDRLPDEAVGISIEKIEDMPDGSAIVYTDMDYETLKLFAKRGLHATLVEAAEKIVQEHGDA